MSKITIQKQIFNKNNFPKVVDTQFSQLINTTQEEDTLSFTLEDFFTLYEQKSKKHSTHMINLI